MKRPSRNRSTAAPFSTENLDAGIEIILDNGCSFNYYAKGGSSIIPQKEKVLKAVPQYQPEQWRQLDDCRDELGLLTHQDNDCKPGVRDQGRLLELLGRINYQILTGNRVYIEVNGVVYKTLFGAYWRSVFTGIEHYLLKCEEIPTSRWAESSDATPVYDLPIVYSDRGWTAGGFPLSLMIYRT